MDPSQFKNKYDATLQYASASENTSTVSVRFNDKTGMECRIDGQGTGHVPGRAFLAGGHFYLNNVESFEMGHLGEAVQFELGTQDGQTYVKVYLPGDEKNVIGYYEKAGGTADLSVTGKCDISLSPGGHGEAVRLAEVPEHGFEALLNFTQSVEASFITSLKPVSIYVSVTDYYLPDMDWIECETTSAKGQLSWNVGIHGTLKFDDVKNLGKKMTYKAVNAKDGATITFYGPYGGKALAQFAGEYVKHLTLNLEGECDFTVTPPEDIYSKDTVMVSVQLAGTAVNVSLRDSTSHSAHCKGTNSSSQPGAISLSLPSRTLWYDTWDDFYDSHMNYTFALNKVNNGVPFIHFYSNFKEHPNTDPFEIGWLSLGHVHVQGELDVSGTCEWSK